MSSLQLRHEREISAKLNLPHKTVSMANQRSFPNAVKWAYTGIWGDKALSALFTFVLAGILGPRDFGVVSIAMIYIAFFQMFLDQGLMAALIQKKNLERGHLDAVFWVDIALSLFLVGLSVLLSGWWAARNHAPELGKIICVLSFCIPIEALDVVQSAILRRDMNFKGLSIRSNFAALLGGIVGIGMALAGFGIWALVGQQLAKDSIALVALWRLSEWRPRFEFCWRHLVDLTGFSIWTFVAQLANFADMQFASVLLGLFLGPVAVGLYRLADRLVGSVVSMATSSIQAVSLPEFSRNQDNPEQLRRSALSCIRLSSVVTLPVLAGLAAVSRPLMTVLGTKWIPASRVLEILSVMGGGAVFIYFTGPMMQALSKTRRIAALEWCRTITGLAILVAVALSVQHGSLPRQLVGIALARSGTVGLLVAPVFVYVLMRLCKISLLDLGRTIMPAAMASMSVVASVLLLHASGLCGALRPSVCLLAEVASGGAAGLFTVLAFDPQIRQFVFANVGQAIRYPAMLR
jgi:O-antigen/teichoic acid export membrane protein